MTSTPVPREKSAPVLTMSSLLLLAACGGGGSVRFPAGHIAGVATACAARAAHSCTPPQPERRRPRETPCWPLPITDLRFRHEQQPCLAGRHGSDRPTAPRSAASVARDTGIDHQHSLVSIYKNGVRMGPPDNVGHAACSYELHTHDVTGMVHIHSDVEKTFTLGQFFTLWGQPLAAGNTAGLGGPVRFYLIQNEQLTPYAGDPAQLALVPHREIVIISGASPGVVPKYRWPSSL